MTLSWLWCWCRFMSASPGFHFWLLSGSRAHRDTCVPPITELWKFLGFKHCSLIHFHFHICYCYHRAELFCVSPQLLLLSLNMNSLYTSTPAQLCAPNFCVQYICCVWQKVHLASCTLLKTPYLDTWNFDWSSSPIGDLMMRTRSDPWDKIDIILWEPKKLPKR